MVIRLRRLGNKVCGVGGPLAGILLGWTGAAPVFAQPPTSQSVAAEQPAQRNYLNKNHIRLPIQINDADRPTLQEVQLYIKEHRNAPWTLKDKVAPTQKAFTVQLPRDGEYAFTMVTVNKQGRRDPEDLRTEPARLIVVIDTLAPRVEVTNLGEVPEGQLIQFDVSDVNLDNGRVRFAYQGGDRVFHTLESLPDRSNLFCIPAQAVFTGIIRATAQDMAGNSTVVEEHVSKLATRKGLAQNPAPAAVPLITPPTLITPPSEVNTVQGSEAPRNLPPSVAVAPSVTPPPLPTVEPTPVKTVVARPDPNEHHLPDHVAPPTVSAPPVIHQTNHSVAAKKQFVNNAKLFLDYQLEDVGTSGVGKLQVWVTRDQNKTWTKLSETTHQGCPVEVQLPGEGHFGVTLVAVNGRGIAGAAPAAGDTPDWCIEVDTTKPTVEISKISAVAENNQYVVHIHWTAQDKNIGEAPVELLYAATPQGPWLPIAKGLKAEGQHRWTPPSEIGAQAFVRLIARDAAGNTTVVNTMEPVLIGDQARPRAVIRGISTNAPAPVPVVPAEGVAPKSN